MIYLCIYDSLKKKIKTLSCKDHNFNRNKYFYKVCLYSIQFKMYKVENVIMCVPKETFDLNGPLRSATFENVVTLESLYMY